MALKIAYLSSQNPLDKKVWSGTHYSIHKTLSSIGEVIILGPFEPKYPIFVGKVQHYISQKYFKKRYNFRHSILVSKAYGEYFTAKLQEIKPDLIVAPAASTELAFVKTDVPIIYITDGTFASCLDYHASLTDLNKKSKKEGDLIERMAIEKSKHVIVSSEWAAKSVINDYQKSSKAVHIIPFGANFDVLPERDELQLTTAFPFKLLFVGVDWMDKGGYIAFNAFLRLNERYIDASLTVLGCEMPFEVTNHYLTLIPFIDKNSEDGQAKLAQIFKEHHLLVLPTRFDCTPIVIAEASAFGLPTVVSKTGGVEGHLKENVNGLLVSKSDEGYDFSYTIEDLIEKPEKYLALRKSSRDYYESTLNWNHWKQEFLKVINS